MKVTGADIQCCGVSPFPVDSLNSEWDPKFSTFYDFFLDLSYPWIRAAKKRKNQTWPASNSLVFGNNATTDFKPESFVLLVKDNIFGGVSLVRCFYPSELKGKKTQQTKVLLF